MSRNKNFALIVIAGVGAYYYLTGGDIFGDDSGSFGGTGGGGTNLTPEGVGGTTEGGTTFNIELPKSSFTGFPEPGASTIEEPEKSATDWYTGTVDWETDNKKTVSSADNTKKGSTSTAIGQGAAYKYLPMSDKDEALAARGEPGQYWSLNQETVEQVDQYVGTPGTVVDNVIDSFDLEKTRDDDYAFSEHTGAEQERSMYSNPEGPSIWGLLTGSYGSSRESTLGVASAAPVRVSSQSYIDTYSTKKQVAQLPTDKASGLFYSGSNLLNPTVESVSTVTSGSSNRSYTGSSSGLTKKAADEGKAIVSLREASNRNYSSMVPSTRSSSSSRGASSTGSSSGLTKKAQREGKKIVRAY